MADYTVDDQEGEDNDLEAPSTKARKDDLSRKAGVKKQMLDIFKEVEKGYEDQASRSDDLLDYWDIYNTKLTGKQFYNGTSQIFVPAVHNAVNARKTRFTNQIFPQSGRYVETTSSDGTQPDSLTALLEHYVRKAKLRTKVMPALVKNGDIEGQYNIYISWCSRKRNVTWRTMEVPELAEGVPNPAADEVETMDEEEIEDAYPEVEVLHDADVLVLPATADTVDEAVYEGGSATIIRRWGKAKIRQMVKEGAIREDEGAALLKELQTEARTEDKNPARKMVDAAGVKGYGVGAYAQVYETWACIKIAKGERRLCQMFFGGEQRMLGCRRNPNWSDKVPLLSVPVEKVSESFKGISKIKPCADLQYQANDAVNEAMDSAAYALMPIVMTDPNNNPRVGSMVLSLAAVWETDPKSTEFAQFPALWKDGLEIVANCVQQISQTLSVSPAAITTGIRGRLGGEKPTQAEVAQEQQVDILTTADAVTVIEEGILTPMLALFLELDHQHRDKMLTVKQFGQMGVQAGLEEVPPIQMEHRYVFRWFGVEQARSAQQIQQQIAGMNVIRGIPPQQLNGYQVNLVPVVTQLVENTFGPRLAPMIFVKPEDQMPVPVEQENQLLAEGFDVPTHEMDDDQAHMQAHMMLLQQLGAQPGGGKNTKKIQTHIFKHVQQGQRKQMAAVQAQVQAQQGAPGVPGGAGPGVAGTPREGAQPGQPRVQGPPGLIHQDQLQDPSRVPRPQRLQ